MRGRMVLSLLLTIALGSPAVFAETLPVQQNALGLQCRQFNARGQCVAWKYVPIIRTPVRTVTPSLQALQLPRISVRGSGAPRVAARGQTVVYTFYVRNEDAQVRTTDLIVSTDPNAVIVSATEGARNDGTVIRWYAQRIPARGSRTFVLRMRVRGNAATGTPMVLRVQAGGSTDTIETTVVDSGGYYENSIRVTGQGIYVRTGRGINRREQPLRYVPTYEHDEFRQVRERSRFENPGMDDGLGDGSCDPTVFVCR